jgi:hypothetical protein
MKKCAIQLEIIVVRPFLSKPHCDGWEGLRRRQIGARLKGLYGFSICITDLWMFPPIKKNAAIRPSCKHDGNLGYISHYTEVKTEENTRTDKALIQVFLDIFRRLI